MSIATNTNVGLGYAVVTWTEPTVTDNAGDFNLTSDYQPGDQFLIGDTLVTYTATDPSGNRAMLSFHVNVTGNLMTVRQHDLFRIASPLC